MRLNGSQIGTYICTDNVKRRCDLCRPWNYSTLGLQLDGMKKSTTIKETHLREVIQASGPVRTTILGAQGGFEVQFHIGDLERQLVNSRGSTRMFAILDTAATFVQERGITRFEVDMTGYKPGRLRSARPDRAEALRGTRTKLQQQPLEFHDGE
jgi:hypothetical protein